MTTATASRESQLLNRALERLRTENRRVSVRSLAQRLSLSPSYLSKIFRGERGLPLKQVAGLAKALQLDHHETAELQRLILSSLEEKETGGATGIRSLSAAGSNPLQGGYETFGQNDFWLLEEPHLLPLLNLVTTQGFRNEPAWIAARLGITRAQARDSVTRLQASGHLRRRENGGLERTHLKLRFPTQRSHPSVRRYHQAMIRKAGALLLSTPTDKEFSERLISGVAFAGDPARLAEARLVLEEAVYKAAELLAGGENCTEVFQLNLQLFKLTRDGCPEEFLS